MTTEIIACAISVTAAIVSIAACVATWRARRRIEQRRRTEEPGA